VTPTGTAATGTAPTSRRERQREATYAEIVETSIALLREGEDLSLRALAQRMGMTAPALYRYVASYQELVDLVAFEIDRAATERFRAVADTLPEDDVAGRLCLAATEFRQWAHGSPREFGLVFANPVADSACVRREALTLSSSGHLFTDQMRAIWEANHFPVPAVEDLPPAAREAVLDPLIPAKSEGIAPEDRGLMWVYMQGWTQLYGVVTLEVFGHMDPRLVESGDLFVDTMLRFAPRMGLEDDLPRLEALIRAHLSR
jgi:AcrR family transcriptional regulator